MPLVQYNLRYPGQYFDEESGLHYNHFRSYDSKSGRYTQADPIGLEGGWNRFAYVGGNALGFVDPYGLLTLDDIAFLTPEKAATAAQYWAEKHNQTGNWGYAIPGMAAALLAEHYDAALMAMCSVRGVGGAQSIKQAADLSKHLGYTSKYGQGGINELASGRIRYYGDVQPASKAGEMAGRRYVHEFDPATGRSRGWHETLDQAGNVRQVRPELNNGSKNHYRFDSNGNYTGSW